MTFEDRKGKNDEKGGGGGGAFLDWSNLDWYVNIFFEVIRREFMNFVLGKIGRAIEKMGNLRVDASGF